MKNLRQCLIDCDMAMLRAIAQRRGIELTSNRQREVVEQLAEELAQPESMADILEKLEPQEQEALESLVSEGGRNKLHLFVRQYGEIRAFGPGSLERERPWEAPISAAEGLWYSGLVYRPSMSWRARPASSSSCLRTCCPSCLELRKHRQPSS